MDLSNEALSEQIDSLKNDWSAYTNRVRERSRAYLRAYSPPFESKLQEHDQWTTKILPEDTKHARSSFNETRPVVNKWSALEASEFPNVRWIEDFVRLPVPDMDEAENTRRQNTYRAEKLVAGHIATLREQTLYWHIRRMRADRHWFRAVRKKNLYGRSWMRVTPDLRRQSFVLQSRIDPTTVFPLWSAWLDNELDAILVAYPKSARLVDAQFPGVVKLDRDGTASDSSYYIPADSSIAQDRRFVWVEDFWVIDRTATVPRDVVAGEPVQGLVVNATRANGKIVNRTEYAGWKRLPYIPVVNEDERDDLGWSDAGAMLPIQDTLNRMMSQQADVIYGESRPRFKFRTESGRQLDLIAGEAVTLEPDEDVEQITVHLDAWPAQIHGTQLRQIEGRTTGLPPTVHGEITAAQNSGRALATAWKATATSLVPRNFDNSDSIDILLGFMLDTMELYDWDEAPDLYGGNRDFEIDFPNQEPRDRNEVVLEATNMLNAGLVDQQGAMVVTGERSPDEMLERVRADYMDMVLHPEKGQAFLALQQFQQRLAIEAQQAGLQQQAAMLQMQQMASAPPGGMPAEQMAAQSQQAQTQAAQQAAPQLSEGMTGPATQAGQPANAANPSQTSTMIQGGEAFNRIITKGEI